MERSSQSRPGADVAREVAKAHRPRFMGAGTLAATAVAVVLAAVATALAPGSGALLTAVMTTYLALATAGMAWAERRGARAIPWMLGAQVPLVLGALALSEGRAFLVAMPFVSVVMLFLRLRVALALVLALVVFFAVLVTRAHSLAMATQAVVGFASACGFVVAFSHLVRRERFARAEVERLVEDLRRANEQLSEYVTQVEELATTRERNRIAREVHDGLGHTLTVATVQLEAARARVGDPQADERLARVQQILREGLGELRRSVSMLRVSPSTPQAFARAIAELVEDSNESGLATELVTEGTPRPLPGAVGFTLYRTAQEALTNARRHARARVARIRLTYGPEHVSLCVEDDGVGAAELAPGHGLTGLRERIELVGGSVEIDTAAGEGLRLRVELPG